MYKNKYPPRIASKVLACDSETLQHFRSGWHRYIGSRCLWPLLQPANMHRVEGCRFDEIQAACARDGFAR